MNTVRFAVSVRHFTEYNPFEFCAFIEHWAASNNGRVKVSCQQVLHHENTANLQEDMLLINVEYDNYPTSNNYLIEIKQFVKFAAEAFYGIECIGINAA